MSDRTAAEWAETAKTWVISGIDIEQAIESALLSYGAQERQRALGDAAALAERFDLSVNFGLALATRIRALASETKAQP